MARNVCITILMMVLIVPITGCSGSGIVQPIDEPGNVVEDTIGERQSESQHALWGFWTIHFDPVSLKLEAVPLRNIEMHIDITDMILPPACENCLEIIFNSFQSETGILKFGIILRNEFPVTGHDVRGIIFTDDAGHLLMNADDWTGIHDITGGQVINPFKGFYGLYGESKFGPDETRYENFEVYIPNPPDFEGFNFAVDASYPGKCKEPYTITGFSHPPLYDVTGHSVIAEVTVSDWQDDVNKVTLVAPEITGESFTQFYPFENIWRVQITNNTGAAEGEYVARIVATSAGSDTLALHDFVTIEIDEATTPIILAVIPVNANAGTSLVDVNITGANFSGPESEVVLSCDYGPDIVATGVEVIDQYLLHADIDIPIDAWVGAYDVEVTDSLGEEGTGDGLFEILTPSPVVLGIEPYSVDSGASLEGVTISGLAFIGPNAQVKLKKDSVPDIEASNVSVVDWETITCDLDIPWTFHTGPWDVEVINDDLKNDIGEDLMTINCPEPWITSVDPNNHSADDSQFTLTVHGDKFVDGPDLAVKLREGGQTDIEATNVTWIDVGTLTCDLVIPDGTPTAYWDVEVTNGCGEPHLKIDTFHVKHFAWNEPYIALDAGFNTKVRDNNMPTISSYQSTTDFVIQGDLCTGAHGMPVYQYYISTSDTEQVGSFWHEFTFTGDNIITVNWYQFWYMAPSEVYLWVRCVDDPDSAGPYLFETPLQLSHQLWYDDDNFGFWTYNDLAPGACCELYNDCLRVYNNSISGTDRGYVFKLDPAEVFTDQNYTFESCSDTAWTPYPDCWVALACGHGMPITCIGPEITYLEAGEYLSVSFSAPYYGALRFGFEVNDGCGLGLMEAFNFVFDNVCLFHDPS